MRLQCPHCLYQPSYQDDESNQHGQFYFGHELLRQADAFGVKTALVGCPACKKTFMEN